MVTDSCSLTVISAVVHASHFWGEDGHPTRIVPMPQLNPVLHMAVSEPSDGGVERRVSYLLFHCLLHSYQ